LWIVAEGISTAADKPLTSILTLGYDPARQKYVGTWIDSTTSHLWSYEGTVDAAGKALTLESEGPGAGGKPCRFRDVIEFQDGDHKTVTSSIRGEDGTWTTYSTVSYRRTR
jgi:hypothetical protein